VKRILAIGIVGLLGMVLLALALGDPLPANRSRAWFLLGLALLVGVWLTARQHATRSSKRQPISSGWQGQSRGTATTLLVTGAIAMTFGFLYDAANPPNRYGLLFFSTAAVCLGIGIHRNVRVVHSYFGPGWGGLLNVLQFVLPAIAFVLDYAAELVTDQGTKWLLRVLGVIPFVFLYLVMWVPLSRFTPGTPPVDETTFGKLG
jgi:hypothetical protein